MLTPLTVKQGMLVPLLLAALTLGSSACGGSSSETPFPLEPDFQRMDAGGPPSGTKYVVFSGTSASAEDAGTTIAEPDEGE